MQCPRSLFHARARRDRPHRAIFCFHVSHIPRALGAASQTNLAPWEPRRAHFSHNPAPSEQRRAHPIIKRPRAAPRPYLAPWEPHRAAPSLPTAASRRGPWAQDRDGVGPLAPGDSM